MNNQTDKNRIFTPSGCLNQDTILLYISGKAIPDDVRRIELHLSDCPLCSDAVEGLMALSPQTNVMDVLQEVKSKIFEEEKGTEFNISRSSEITKTRSMKSLYIGIAASIALLITGYFSIRYLGMNDKNKELVSWENNKKTENEKSAAPGQEENTVKGATVKKEDSISDNFHTVTGKTEATGGDRQQPVLVSRIVNETDASDLRFSEDYKTVADNIFTVDDVTLETEGAKEKQSVDQMQDKDMSGEVTKNVDDGVATGSGIVNSNSVLGAKKSNNRNSENDRSNKSVEEVPAANTSTAVTVSDAEQKRRDEINNGIESYNQGYYSEAATKFELALDADPSDQQALYYGGMAYYYSKEYDKAVQSFNKLLKNKKNPYYQASQWQLAVIYLEKGETKLARKTLNEVIDENGPYRSNAVDEINKLDK
jgi:TolA-binding protein